MAFLDKTEIGLVAHDYWLRISEIHSHIEIDEFIIMPDHLHGILFFNKPDKTSREVNKFGAQKNNLAAAIRGYKSSVKKYANDLIDFSWQSRYYDRVIRDEKEYQNIIKYINGNPNQWLANKDGFENLYL